MNSRRTLIIVLAVAVAAVAAIANVTYLDNVQNKAYEGAKRVYVYRVKQDIPKGMQGEQAVSKSLIERKQIPQEFRPGNALTSEDQLHGKVALANLSAGQVVVDGMFVDPIKAQTTTRDRILPGQVAFTVSVDQIHGVGNLLFPGDQVDIMVKDEKQQTRLLYQNVDILFIGTSAAPQAGETAAKKAPAATAGSGIITFAAPVDAAERIVAAARQPDGLYLALVPRNNKPLMTPPVIGKDALFTGTLTPCGNDKACSDQ
jgi:pilus assembly protein CpaB